jgi:hypothetical protein
MRQRLALGVAVGMVLLVVLASAPVAAQTGSGTGFSLIEFLNGIASAFGDVSEFIGSFADFLDTQGSA